MNTSKTITLTIAGLIAIAIVLLIIQLLLKKLKSKSEIDGRLKLSYGIWFVTLCIAGSSVNLKTISVLSEAIDNINNMNIQNTKKTQVAIMNAVHDLPVLVARDRRFFKDEGLCIEFVTTPGMAQVTTSHLVQFVSVFERLLAPV